MMQNRLWQVPARAFAQVNTRLVTVPDLITINNLSLKHPQEEQK